MTLHDDRCLLALQGPAAAEVLAPLVPDLDLNKFYFSNFAKVDVDGKPCFVTRTGCVMLSTLEAFEMGLPRLCLVMFSSRRLACLQDNAVNASRWK